MELKPETACKTGEEIGLLIVPYGIETLVGCVLGVVYVTLLIVPYGIETDFIRNFYVLPPGLLIVPYGIETKSSVQSSPLP